MMIPYVPAGLSKLPKAAKVVDRTVDGVKQTKIVGSVPKPLRGKGAVPPSQRDPKRKFTKKEKAEKLKEQGGKCVGCDSDLDISDSKGHHRGRHADGAPTTKDNLDVVCPDCHKEIHSQ